MIGENVPELESDSIDDALAVSDSDVENSDGCWGVAGGCRGDDAANGDEMALEGSNFRMPPSSWGGRENSSGFLTSRATFMTTSKSSTVSRDGSLYK